MQCQQSRLLSKPGFSVCIPNCIHKSQVIYIIFQPKGPINILQPFCDKGLSTRRLICVDLPKVWCHSQKALNKVTFLHSKDTATYNKQREYSDLQQKRSNLLKSLVLLTSKLLCIFFYILLTLTNILPGAQKIKNMEAWQQSLSQQ